MVKIARKGEQKAWDPIELWAYVLGEEEEEDDRKIRLFRRRKEPVEDEDEGILSYILPQGGGEGESRDESLPNEGTLEDSYATNTSLEESREQSESRSVIASLFSWGSTKRDEEPREENAEPQEDDRREWQLNSGILGVAPSEKSDDTRKRRSLLSRSKSDTELASMGKINNSNRSLKKESTVGKWLDSNAIASSSNDDDTGDYSDDTDDEPWILGVTDEILGLSSEEELQRRKDKRKSGGSLLELRKKKEPPPQDMWTAMSAGLSSSGEASRKERASISSDKSSKGEPGDQILSIRGLVATRRDSNASDHSKGQFDQQSWGMLGLASSNETPQSFSGSPKPNRKRGTSAEKPKDVLSMGSWMSASAEGDASAKKKERRGLLAIGKPKAAKDPAKTTAKDDTTIASKKKERRGLNIRISKSDQSKASDSRRSDSGADGNATNKKERRSLFKGTLSKDASQARVSDAKTPTKKGRRSFRVGRLKPGKSGSDSSLGVGLRVQIEETSDSEGLALEPEMGNEPNLVIDDKKTANTEKLQTKVKADESSGLGKVEAWLFGLDSDDVEDKTKPTETCKPESSMVPDGAKRLSKQDASKNQSGKSWLFSVLSHEEEPKKKDGISLLSFESPELCANIGDIDEDSVPSDEASASKLEEKSWLSEALEENSKNPEKLGRRGSYSCSRTPSSKDVVAAQTAEPSASESKEQSGESFGVKSLEEEPKKERRALSLGLLKSRTSLPIDQSGTREGDTREQREEDSKKGGRGLSISRSKSKASDQTEEDGGSWMSGVKIVVEEGTSRMTPSNSKKTNMNNQKSAFDSIKSEPKQQSGASWLFDGKTLEEDSKQGRRGISFGRSKKTNDTKPESIEGELKEQNTESWLFGVKSVEEEPSKRRRSINFGRSKKVTDDAPESTEAEPDSWLFGGKNVEEEPNQRQRGISFGRSKKANDSDPGEQGGASWLFGGKCPEKELKKGRRSLSFSRSKKSDDLDDIGRDLEPKERELQEYWLFGPKSPEAEPKMEKRVLSFRRSKKNEDLHECEPKEGEPHDLRLFGVKSLEEVKPKKERRGLNFGRSKKADGSDKSEPRENEPHHQDTQSWLFGVKSHEEVVTKKERNRFGFGLSKKADVLTDPDDAREPIENEPRESEPQRQNTESWLLSSMETIEEAEPKKKKLGLSFGRSNKGGGLNEPNLHDAKESEPEVQSGEPWFIGGKNAEEDPQKERRRLSFGLSQDAVGMHDPSNIQEPKETQRKEQSKEPWLFGSKTIEEAPEKERRGLNLTLSRSKQSSNDGSGIVQNIESEPKEQSGESWLTGKAIPNEESHQGRRGLTFGRSQSRAFESWNQDGKLETACDTKKAKKCAVQKASETALSGHTDQSRGSFFSTNVKNNNPSSSKGEGDFSNSSKKKGDRVRRWSFASKLAKKVGPLKKNKALSSGEKVEEREPQQSFFFNSNDSEGTEIQERKRFSRSKKKEEEREQPSWFYGTNAEKSDEGKPKNANTTNKQDEQQKDSWLFGLKSGKGTQGEASASTKTESREKREHRAWFSGGRNKSETEPDDGGQWIWTIDSAIWPTGEEPTIESDNEDSKSSKSKKRVHFAGFGKKQSKKEPEEAASGWQGAQTLFAGFKDWVTASSSGDTWEEEGPSSSIQPPVVRQKASEFPEVELSANQGADTPDTAFGMGTFFSSWVPQPVAADGATTSSGASTSDSSVTSDSVTTDDASDEGMTTQQGEDTSIVTGTAEDQDQVVNEVRLAFRPISDNEGAPEEDDQRDMLIVAPEAVDPISILPVVDLAHEKHHLYFDGSSTDDSVSQNELSEQTNRALTNVETMDQILEDDASHQSEDAWIAKFKDFPSDHSVERDEYVESTFDDPPELFRDQLKWKMCCSVKNLSPAQQQWSAESGIPFHELSQRELLTIFPKVKSVSDQQQYSLSSDLGDPSVHHEADPNFSGPRSVYQYEYETGIHMFASYDKFESISSGKLSFQVTTAKVPRLLANEGGRNSVVVQVEASTVSLTDCYIRQGQWWGKDAVQLPNIPGVDFVGKLYRIDENATNRYGLSIGDRVVSLVKWGGNGRFISVDPSTLVKVPESLDPASTVCLTETYLKAFQMLHQGQRGKMRYRMDSLNGKSILIIGSAVSNLGRAIANLASVGGAVRIHALAKQKHYQELRSMGVSPLSTESPTWWPSLIGDVDYVISLEGKIDRAYHSLLKPDGQVVIVKLNNSVEETDVAIDTFFDIKSCRKKRLEIRSKSIVYDLFEEWDKDTELCMNDLQHLVDLLVQKKIEPAVLDRITLDKVAGAQQLVESKRLTGFMVCEPWLIAKSRTVCL